MKKGFLILFILFIFIPFMVGATSCPKGKINDPYPGDCGLYVDENNNNICDKSELVGVDTDNQNISVQENSEKHEGDNIMLITFVLLALYFSSLTLVYTKKMSIIIHKKIWNWALLLVSIPVFLTSILLVFRSEFGWSIDLSINLNELHVVSGWIFLLIAMFHTFWHFKYYFSKK